MSRDAGLELVWPGKYQVDGTRTPIPRRHPVLHPDFTLPPTPGAVDRGPEPAPDLADTLIVADNLLALDALVEHHAGTVDLVVADPPFATGGKFEVVTRVGQGDTAAEIRTPAYSDTWQGGTAGLIAMLDPRLRLAHALLAPHGSLYLHVDPTVGHAAKLLLDDIFGAECFQREIVWRIGWVSGFKTKARNWIRNHDLIFFYVKDPKHFTFNKFYVPYPKGYKRRDGAVPTGRGVPLDDVWNASDVEHGLRGAASMDSIQIKSFSQEKTGYATQKNESLLRRIIAASSNPGDRVLDPFCGSGTTLAVARALGRRFTGIDTSRAAMQICLRRIAGTPGPAIHVQHVQPTERVALAERGHDWQHWAQATPPPSPVPGLLGTREGRGVVVVQDHVAGPDDLSRATTAAQGPAEVLAWSWALPVPSARRGGVVHTGVPAAFGGPAVALRIERDVLGPHPQPRVGLSPLCCPRLSLCVAAPGELSVTLLGLTEGWPADRPAAGAALPSTGLALVDGWAVDASGAGGAAAPCFGFSSFRRHHRRALTDGVVLPWRGERLAVRVRVWDVLHRTVDLRVTLAAASPVLAVGRVELQVGIG